MFQEESEFPKLHYCVPALKKKKRGNEKGRETRQYEVEKCIVLNFIHISMMIVTRLSNISVRQREEKKNNEVLEILIK